MSATYRVGEQAFLPQFGCFAEVVETVKLRDGDTGYRVSNEGEGITNMLLREYEMLGVVPQSGGSTI